MPSAADQSGALVDSSAVIPAERIESRIVLFRGEKVMLDSDLAELYGVETKVLNQAASRNADRFPADFMFRLTQQEYAHLKSQIVTSSSGHGGRRKLPLVFTEQGVAMLSGLLNSSRAVAVNIAIMRTFVRLRQLISSHAELDQKLATLERKYDGQFKAVFDAIRALMAPDSPAKRREMGFHTGISSLRRPGKQRKSKT